MTGDQLAENLEILAEESFGTVMVLAAAACEMASRQGRRHALIEKARPLGARIDGMVHALED